MVWIDQDLCTGDGICSEICPDVFVAREDGLWVVKEESSHFGTTIIFDGGEGAGHGPDMGKGVARILIPKSRPPWTLPRNAPASAS